MLPLPLEFETRVCQCKVLFKSEMMYLEICKQLLCLSSVHRREGQPWSLPFDSHSSIKAQNEIPSIVPKWRKDHPLQLQITHYYCESQHLEIQSMIFSKCKKVSSIPFLRNLLDCSRKHPHSHRNQFTGSIWKPSNTSFPCQRFLETTF